MTVVDVNTGKFTGSRRQPRGDRHQEQPRGGRGDRPPAAPARHRRHHRRRLHRHGAGVQPRPGAAPPRGVPRPRPHQAPGRRGHLARPGADDAQAASALGLVETFSEACEVLRRAAASSCTTTLLVKHRARGRPGCAGQGRRRAATAGESRRPQPAPQGSEARAARRTVLPPRSGCPTHGCRRRRHRRPRWPSTAHERRRAEPKTRRAAPTVARGCPGDRGRRASLAEPAVDARSPVEAAGCGGALRSRRSLPQNEPAAEEPARGGARRRRRGAGGGGRPRRSSEPEAVVPEPRAPRPTRGRHDHGRHPYAHAAQRRPPARPAHRPRLRPLLRPLPRQWPTGRRPTSRPSEPHVEHVADQEERAPGKR